MAARGVVHKEFKLVVLLHCRLADKQGTNKRAFVQDAGKGQYVTLDVIRRAIEKGIEFGSGHARRCLGYNRGNPARAAFIRPKSRKAADLGMLQISSRFPSEHAGPRDLHRCPLKVQIRIAISGHGVILLSRANL